MTMTADMVTRSATIVSQIVLLKDGVPNGSVANIVTGGGSGSGTAGTVTVDATAANLRTCSFQCVDPSGLLAPGDNGGGALAIGVTEVSISSGFVIDGELILYPQGIFGVQEVDIATGTGNTNDPGPLITVTGVDRSARVAANLFADTFTIPVGTTIAPAIQSILASQAPWVMTNIAPSDFVLAQQVASPGQDPWAFIVQLAAAAGMVAYFDTAGILVVRPNPAKAGGPLAIGLQDGPAQLMTDITAVTSNVPGYNGVIVVGTSLNGTAPIIGTAFDMDPNSPTYAAGPYGYRPAPPVSVSTVTGTDQANAMAATLLPQTLGRTRQLAIDLIPAPYLDAYDLVYVDNAATNVNGTYIVQQAVISLDFSALQSLTLVPLGAPISQLAPLSGPSIAQFASAPYAVGGSNFAWTPYSGYTTSAYGGGAGGGGGGALGVGGLLGGAGIGQLLWPNGLGRSVLWGGATRYFRRPWNPTTTPGSVDSNGYVWQSDAQYYSTHP